MRLSWVSAICLRGLCVVASNIGLSVAEIPVSTEGHAVPPPFAQRLQRDFTAPWSLQSAGFLAAGAGLSLVSLQHEQQPQMVQALDRSSADGFFDIGDRFGAGETIAGLAAASWLGGALTQRPGLVAFGQDLTSAFVATSAYTWAFKLSFDRERPNGGAHSFPSGHTALAFAAASVVDRHTGPLPSLGAYLLASATMAGRMEDNRHYLSDVLFGATLGLTVGGAPPTRTPFLWLREHLMIGKKGVGVRGSF